MTGLDIPRQRFSDQLMLTGDTKIQSDRSPGHTGNLLTLTRCHTIVLCGIFPWLAKGIILFWVKFKSFICLIGNSELVFVHICPFPNKNSLVTLVFLRWSFNLSLNSERSNLQKLLCATVLINFAIFLEKKNKSKFPVRSKVRRNGQAGTGLER